MEKIRWIAIGMILGFLLFSCISYIYNKTDPYTSIVNDKYENDGHHYISIEKEVTPEEYIGYDIGDDYILEE